MRHKAIGYRTQQDTGIGWLDRNEDKDEFAKEEDLPKDDDVSSHVLPERVFGIDIGNGDVQFASLGDDGIDGIGNNGGGSKTS